MILTNLHAKVLLNHGMLTDSDSLLVCSTPHQYPGVQYQQGLQGWCHHVPNGAERGAWNHHAGPHENGIQEQELRLLLSAEIEYL